MSKDTWTIRDSLTMKKNTDSKPEKRIERFEDFWPFYLYEHRNPLNRKLHFVGTLLALINLGAFLGTRKKRFLLAAPVSGYLFAWIGHFIVEKNRPATFKYPGKSLRGDFKMFGLMLQGKMEDSMRQARSHDDVLSGEQTDSLTSTENTAGQ